MATEVDERVVEMRFDNDQFEAGIAQSRKSLEALDKSLEMNGSTEGMSALQKVFNKFDISGASDQVNGFAQSFSALDAIAIGALGRIGMKITDFSTNILKKLTIEPVMNAFNSSWGKFEEKTQSVQSILSATLWENEGAGLGIEGVNAELEKLMLFTDETSYNFVDMTGNIAKFTAQRIPLAESTVAMQGIATWAAAAGQSAGEASRAMYNISQAMGVGAMTLIDWKSIQNANMATVEFKELAIQAALAAGTLIETGEAGKYVTTGLNDGKSGLAVSVENFTDAMTQGRWLSKEVMMDTFSMYGDFAQQILQWSEAYDFTVTDMMQFAREFQNGTLDIGKAAEELGMTSEEVATFMSDAFYIGSDVVQYYADEMGLAFEDIVDMEQKYIHGTLDVEAVSEDIGMSIDELTYMLDDLAAGYDDVGYRAMKNAQEAKTFTEVIAATNDALSSAMMRVWETIFGNYEEARGMWTGLANLLYDELVEPVNSLNETLSEWKALGGRNLLIESVKDIWNVLNSIREPIQAAWDAIFPPKDASQRGAGLFLFTQKLRKAIKGLVLNERAQSGIYNGFKILFNILKAGLTVIKGVWQITKPLISAALSLAGIIWDIASALLGVLAPAEDVTQSGLEAFFGIIVDWLSKGTNKIAEWTQGLRDWLVESEVFQSFFQGIKNAADNAFDSVFRLLGYDPEESGLSKTEWLFQNIQNAVEKAWETLQSFWSWIKGTFGGAFTSVSNGLKELWGWIKGIFTDSSGAITGWGKDMGDFFKALGEIAWNGIKNGLAAVKEFLAGVDWKELTATVKNLAATGGIVAIATTFAEFMHSLSGFVGSGEKIAKSFADIFTSIKNTINSYNQDIKSKALIKSSIAIALLAASVIGLAMLPTDKLEIALAAIALLALIAKRLIVAAQGGDAVEKAVKELKGALIEGIEDLVEGAKKMLKSIGTGAMFVGLGIALGALVACFGVILKLVTGATAGQIAGAMAVLTIMLAELVGAAILLDHFGSGPLKKGEKNSKTAQKVIAAITSAVLLMARSLKIVSGIAAENPDALGLSAAVLMTMMTVMILLTAKIVELSNSGIVQKGKNISKVTTVLLEVVGMLVVTAGALSILALYSWEKLLASAAAMSIVMITMTGVTAALVKLSEKAKQNTFNKIGGILLSMAGALSIVALACAVIAGIDWKDLLKTAAVVAGLMVLLGAFLAVMKVANLDLTLAFVGKGMKDFGVGVLALSAGLLVLAAALAALTVVLIPFSAALLASSVILGIAVANLVVSFVTSLAAQSGAIVAAVVAILIALADALLQAMNPIINDLFKQILILLDTLIKYVGPIIEKILIVVTKIIDALAKEIPKIIDSVFNLIIQLLKGIGESLIRRSGELMNAVAEIVSGALLAILAVLGGIGKGIADVLTGEVFDAVDEIDYSQLNTISDDLTEFAQKMETIPDSAVDKAKIMAEVAEVLAGVTWNDNGGGDNPLKRFTAALTDFGSAASTMLVGFKGFTVEEIIIANQAALALKGLAEFANILYAIPYRQGGYQFIIDFATQLENIGPSLTAFGQSISGFTYYEDDIASVSALGPGLAGFCGAIVDAGLYDGAADSFKSMLETMGPAYSGFYDDIKDVNSYKVSVIADAGTKIVDMFGAMSDSDLWWVPDQIVTWLDNLGKGMSAFSQADVKFTRIDGIIDAAVKTVKALTVENLGISSESDIIDGTVLINFSMGLSSFGYYLSSYYNYVKSIDNPAKLWTFTHIIEGMIKGFNGVADLVRSDPLVSQPIVKFGDGLNTLGKKLIGFQTEIKDLNLTRLSDSGKAIADLVSAFGNGEMNLSQYSGDITSLGEALSLYSGALSSFIASSGELQTAAGTIDNAVQATMKIGKMMYLIGKEYHSEDFVDFVMAFLTLGVDSIEAFIASWTSAKAQEAEDSISSFLNECLYRAKNSDSGKTRAEEWKAAGDELVNSLISGFHNSTKLDEGYKKAESTSINIIKGLLAGITGSSDRSKYYYDRLMNKSYDLGKRITEEIDHGAKVRSPSKATIRTGQFIDEGLIIGLQNYESKVESASENVGATSVNAVANSISAVSSAIESGIDLNPVITPILDMSNIQNGMSAMSNLDGSINVGANINSASFRASDMFGAMLDSAFNKLQKSIDRLAQDHDEVPDITIVINGATDPKAVAKEVEVILQKNIKGAGKVYGRA